MARDDLKHSILRPGELHILMAQLRTIDAFIENSGIDMAWIESDLYGPNTVKQILEGNHVREVKPRTWSHNKPFSFYTRKRSFSTYQSHPGAY